MDLELRRSDLNPGQLKLLESADPQVLLAGGFGSGKTTGIDFKLLQLRTVNPGVPGLLVAPTRPLLFAVTVRRLLSLLRRTVPQREMPKIKDPQGECYLDFGDGVPVFLRSATRPDSIDGLDVGWAIGDEIRYWSKQAYDITLGRVRVPCPLPQKAFASTPAMNWMHDEFNGEKRGRKLIIAPTLENIANLIPDFIENLKQSYSPRLQKAVLEGLFCILEGAVYEEFDPQPGSDWFVDFDPTPELLERYPVHMSYDPGYRASACHFIAEVGKMQWVVFDQIQLDNAPDTQVVEVVNARNYPIDEIWVDHAAGATQSTSGLDVLAVLRQIKGRHGRNPMIATINSKQTGGGFAFNHIPFGVDKLRVLLGGYQGLPIRLKFARRLLEMEKGKRRGIVKSLSSYRYPEVKDGKPLTDLPLKDGIFDHDADAIRYWAVGRWMRVHELRSKDPVLSKAKAQGWKIAA